MKKKFLFFLVMISFVSTSLLADQWDGFFKATGFPRKIVDNGKLVILLNGFQKKTQKTPKNEIEKALRLMTKYYNEKSK